MVDEGTIGGLLCAGRTGTVYRVRTLIFIHAYSSYRQDRQAERQGEKRTERDRTRDIQTSKNSNEASLPAPLLYCADDGASESWGVGIGLGEQTGGYPYRIQRLQGSA